MSPRRPRILSRTALVVLLIAGAASAEAGCARSQPAGGAQQAGEPETGPGMAWDLADLSREEQVELLERDLRRHFGPEVRVGQIRRVAAATRGVLIVDLDTSGLREGGSLLFVNEQGRAVAGGTLLVVKPHELIAEYDETLVDNGRAVTRDDLAVLNLRP